MRGGEQARTRTARGDGRAVVAMPPRPPAPADPLVPTQRTLPAPGLTRALRRAGGAAPARRRITRARWSAGWLVALLCAGSFTASLVLQATLYRYGSGDADEAAYVLQARMLLRGQLTLDAATWEPFARPWLTGEHDGRLFTKYLPGWPALLAASQALFATMAVAPALVAAGWVAGTYRLARELFDDAATGVLAAASVALSPLVWLHTALPLAYACGAATLTLSAAALLRGARTGARASLLAGGAGAGFALLLRPYDAALVLTVVAVFALQRARGEGEGRLGTLARRAGWVALGAAPFLAVLTAYCWWVTGAPLRLPLSASDPLDRFGFGPRRILPSEPTFGFGRRLALRAAVESARAAPGWLFGGPLLVALAAVGLLVRARRSARLALLAMIAAIGGGYLFWWGSAFAMPGLRDGLGPHYHLAALSPVLILAAAGARWLWTAAGPPRRVARARPVVAGVLVVVAVACTAVSIPPKLRAQQWVNDNDALLDALLPDHLRGPAVVVVTPTTPSRYTQVPYQTLRNGPDPRARLLYAADLGPRTATLPDRMPGRDLYRLRPEEIVDPAAPASYRGSFTALHQLAARRVELRVSAALPVAPRALAAPGRPGGAQVGPGELYVRVGAVTRTFPVPPGDAAGAGATVGLTTTGPTGPTGGEIFLDPAGAPGEVVVGLAVPGPAGVARWEERIPFAHRSATGELTLLTPGLGWREVPSHPDQGWVPAAVRPTLTITVTAA